MSAAERASKQTRKRSEQTSELPNTYVPILGCSEPLWVAASGSGSSRRGEAAGDVSSGVPVPLSLDLIAMDFLKLMAIFFCCCCCAGGVDSREAEVDLEALQSGRRL